MAPSPIFKAHGLGSVTSVQYSQHQTSREGVASMQPPHRGMLNFETQSACQENEEELEPVRWRGLIDC